MDAYLVYLGVAALIILVPGPDTALVTKNAVIHGRGAALGTAVGVCTGLALWTLASALGVASLLRASGTAYTALKVVGAAYLLWLGLQALRHARSHWADDAPATGRAGLDARGGFRQGVLSNLANPKIAVFFTSLLPHFIGTGQDVFLPFLGLGATFVAMTLAWLGAFAFVAARGAALLRRPRVKAAVDRVSGTLLIAVGVQVAVDPG